MHLVLCASPAAWANHMVDALAEKIADNMLSSQHAIPKDDVMLSRRPRGSLRVRA